MNVRNKRLSLLRRLGVVALLATFIFILSGATSVLAGDTSYCNGLVFIDSNENGVWDVGEEGYGGEYGVVEESEGEWVWRYRGALITFNPIDNTDPDKMIVLESAGYREPEEHEEAFDVCTHQDLEASLEDGFAETRPCQGTFGFISFMDEVTWTATIAVPEGYRLTTPQTIQFFTGSDVPLLDFGIVPVAAAWTGTGGELAPVVEETAVVTPPPATYDHVVEGTGFVYGLVFIDDNGNGIWDIGEAGYGGEYGVAEENDNEWVWRYRGTAVTLHPVGDTDPDNTIVLLTAGYREPDEDEDAFDICTHQDLEDDTTECGLRDTCVRPCDGTWGLVGAGDDITWEVWVTVPNGYVLTSPNPQYYTTGSGMPPLDFGIAPVAN